MECSNEYITEIDSRCMKYRNLRIRDIVDQTPRHRLRSCCRSNTKTLDQIMLHCAVWNTVATSDCTKTIKPSMESSLRPPAYVPAPCQLWQWRGWRRRKGRDRRWGGRVISGATCMWSPLLYLVGISVFFYLDLRFEFYFFVCALPRPCGGAWRSSIEKVKLQYFMHPESISVIYSLLHSIKFSIICYKYNWDISYCFYGSNVKTTKLSMRQEKSCQRFII